MELPKLSERAGLHGLHPDGGPRGPRVSSPLGKRRGPQGRPLGNGTRLSFGTHRAISQPSTISRKPASARSCDSRAPPLRPRPVSFKTEASAS